MSRRMRVTLENGYVIKSNGHCFSLGEPVTKKKKDGTVYEELKNPAFYPTLESLLICTPNRILLQESKATSLKDLIKEFKGYTSMIKSALES